MISVVHQGTAKPVVPVSRVLRYFVMALFCAASLSADLGQAARREIPGVVTQAHVDPHVITLPVVDGKNIRFTRLSTDDGLPQTKVSQILQDDQGFIWFGSQYGLTRYDGYRFKVFKHEPGRTNSLSGVYIYSLFKDRSGSLWVGCDEFLDKFDPVNESFTHYGVVTKDAQGQTVPVTDISQDHAGLLWLSTSRGLYRFDPSSGSNIRYHHDPNNPFSLSSDQIKSTGEDRKGAFWVANSEGLDAFDPHTGKVTLHVQLRERGEMSFHEDRFGVLWITHVTGAGLAAFDRNTNSLTQFSFHKGHLSDAIPTGAMGVLEDLDGTLWFATMGDGLLRFDRKDRKFIRYRNDPTNPESIGENDLHTLFQDREGNIWVALHMMPPNRFSPKPPLFEKFKHEPGNLNSLSGTMVNGIYEDRNRTLWISAIDALNRVDRKTGKYTFYRIAGPGISARPTAIVEDRSGFLWIGSDGHGLTRFDPKTGAWKTFRHNPTDPFSLSSDLVPHVLIDQSGTLWAATFDGLDRFDAATSRFSVYRRDKQNAEIDIEVKEDHQGALWVGTHSSGLQRFDPKIGQFTAVYKHNSHDPTSLSNNRVNSLHFDRSGTMWVGTQNGLDKLDLNLGKFKTYYEGDGLSGNVVSCILEDERGKLWMSTNNGLSVFDPSTQTFKKYSVADGLPGADLTGWNACYKSSTGEMFFGGFSGGTAFYPNKVSESSYVPHPVLTDFRLFGSSVIPGPHSVLKTAINLASAIQLSHSDNIFSIEFSALAYVNPRTNRYRYRLDDIDKGWREVGSGERLATYTTLPAGNHTFRLEAATSRGPWSPDLTLAITILPPFWQTFWFLMCCAVALCGILALLYRLHVRQLSARFNLRLEERLGERTRIARDLHDTLLQSFHGLMLRLQAVNELLPQGTAKEQLEQTLKRADQAIAEGRIAVYNLRSSATTTNDLAQAVRELGDELGTQDTAVFSLAVEGSPRELRPIIRDELYRIAREALRNAFSHARAHHIEMEMIYAERLFRMRIRDDGTGIPPEILKQGRPGHYGLAGMRERAREIGAKLSVWSGPAAGTEIELSIPGSHAYDKPPKRSLWRLFREKVG